MPARFGAPRAPRGRLGGALALLLGCGCGGQIPAADLPSEPIAFIRQEPRQGIASLDKFMTAVALRLGDEPEEPDEEIRKKHRSAASSLVRTTIALLTPSTGELRTVPDAEFGYYPLDWSRDGLRLLIGRIDPGGEALQLFAWNRLTGARDRPVVDRSMGTAALADGPIRLAHVGRVVEPGASPRLGVLVYVEPRGNEPLADAVPGRDPDVSPDGRSVVFVRETERSGVDPVILLGSLGGGDARPLGRGHLPRFSRDGDWIAYVVRRRGNSDVWLMRSDGSSKRPIAESDDDEESPSPSPDGRFVVYSAARGSEQESQLFLTRVADGTEVQLTKNGQNGRPIW